MAPRLLTGGSGAERLIRLLREPERARGLSVGDWDVVVRVGRAARLLGVLRSRLVRSGSLETVPAPVRAHLDSEAAVVRFHRQMALLELAELGRALAPLSVQVIALKGAAYVLQGVRVAEGRDLSDVDIMVSRADLDRVEQTLVGRGWELQNLHPYDENYYRSWAHELPPLRFPGHKLEVDLHHTILPLTSRLHPDADALVAASRALPESHFRVFCPEDQVLHACAHLFHDSDCSDRLRELVDIDGLLREFGASDGFWDALQVRAELHGLGRPLWYALRYALAILGAPVPDHAVARMAHGRPSAIVERVMDAFVPEALVPSGPERPAPLGIRLRRLALFLRSHWLRMPPWLLARHAANKGWRRGLERLRSSASPAAQER